MGPHFILKCSECEKILMQCRCMEKDKWVKTIVCEECKHENRDSRQRGVDIKNAIET